MALIDSKEFVKVLRNLIKEVTDKTGIGIYEVTNIQTDKYTCDIKDLVFGKLQYKEVPMIGLGLGNLKGVMKFPSQGDLVLVAFMDDTPNPFILGTVFDVFTQTPDNIPILNEDELLISNKTKGARIKINKEDDIIIRATDSSGNADNGSKIVFKSDGSVKVFNRTNHGLEISSSGAVTIRGTSVNFTQSGGVFP